MRAPAAKSKMPCRGEKKRLRQVPCAGARGKNRVRCRKRKQKKKTKKREKNRFPIREKRFSFLFLCLLFAEHFGSAAHVLDDGHLERAACLASAAGNAVACMRAQQRVVFAHRLGDFALRARKV